MSFTGNALFRRVVARNRLAYSCFERYTFRRHGEAIRRATEEGRLRLHLGCGPVLLDGWINVDASLDLGRITARLPEGLALFPSGSAQFIYASHMLEHIGYPAEATAFVADCHRILKPAGILRIVVPGIEKIIEAYERNDEGFFAVQATRHPAWCTTKMEHLMYALQQSGEHKYGYDFETMKKLLRAVGFSRVVQSDFNASEAPGLRVDYRDVKDNHGRYLSLFVDAVK